MTTHDDGLRGWLRLARCPHLRTRDALALVARAGSAAPFAAPGESWLSGLGATPAVARRLCGRRLTRRVERELRLAASRGWTLLGLGDAAYPPLLRAIAAPPLALAVAGDAEYLARPSVAVVGSRRPTAYGLRQTAALAGPLAAAGLGIVSGLARGIDAEAHRAALEAGGSTVAVLATGLDRVYPPEHEALAGRIGRQGALVSEFPAGTPPRRGQFPRRNRVIAGLALAVVVVEAARRSGSLLTARWAAEEGRPLLAVPGRAGEPAAEGALGLIRDGAALACAPEDVLAEIPPELRPALASPGGPAAPALDAEMAVKMALVADLAPAARLVLDGIPEGEEVHVDELAEGVTAPFAEVQAGLFALELAGLVETAPGGRIRLAVARRKAPGRGAPRGRAPEAGI